MNSARLTLPRGPRRTIDWLLVDGVTAGSGEAFDWTNLKVPRGCSRKGQGRVDVACHVIDTHIEPASFEFNGTL
jgi:hypothetical protein